MVDLGVALRDIGSNYGSVSMLTICAEYVNSFPEQNLNQTLSHKQVNLENLEIIMQKHQKLNKIIEKVGFRDIHLLKPILDGKSICVIYNCKPGRHMKFIMDECMKF